MGCTVVCNMPKMSLLSLVHLQQTFFLNVARF
jgi:hypothetical protein